MATRNPGELIRIDAHGMTTEILLGNVMHVCLAGNRSTFLCPPGMGPTIVQRLRMKLSRVRATMDAKGKAKIHFRMEARCYPYTNRKGIRSDCVVLEFVKTKTHEINETVERIVKDANSGGANGQASNDHARAAGGIDWLITEQ